MPYYLIKPKPSYECLSYGRFFLGCRFFLDARLREETEQAIWGVWIGMIWFGMWQNLRKEKKSGGEIGGNANETCNKKKIPKRVTYLDPILLF